MRRWFSKLGSISSANAVRVTSTPASPGSTSVEQLPDSAIPSPPAPFIISKPNIHWNVDFASDPCSWESCFDTHWEAAEELLDDKEEIDYEKVFAVFRHLSCMVQLLMMEANAQPESAIGPILDRHFTHQIMERIVDWAIAAPHFLTPTCQVNLIRLYEIIVGESHTQNHCLLVHKPMLLPLLKLLGWCRESAEKRNFSPSDMDRHFVLLLNQICAKLAEDATLLHFFFDFDNDCDEQFLVFSLLIPYLYDSGDVGQLARDALLLVLSVSRRLKHIAAFIAVKSNFCPVVATGLSGCFSQLSRSVGSMLYVSDDWHKINADDIDSYSSLLDFHSSLIFCNAVVQVAHNYVVSQVITYVYHGFLLPVVLPSLLQGGQDELISSTAYYHLCLESVTEASLVQTIIKLLFNESCEGNKKVLDVIVERISAGNRLSQVSLSLVRTLIDLRCEDIMFDLVFKYLLPCTFLQPNQAVHLKNQNYVRTAAETLLTFIPECTYKSQSLCSQETLHTYLNECRNYVQQTMDACYEKWAWSYDGRNPSFLMLKLSSDDESNPNGNEAFVRHSSVRSSMASARNGLNRYFLSRNAHITAESLRQHTPLPALGERELSSKSSFPYDIADSSSVLDDEGDELIIPPLTPKSLMMMTSSSDYFQFAYGELSETDTEAINPNTIITNDTPPQIISDKESLASTNPNCDTDVEVARSFVLRGWGQVEDMDTFMALLDRVPATKVKHSLEENLALIDSRIQYLEELKAENNPKVETNEFKGDTNNNNDDEYLAPLGQPIECFENQGVGPFLESVLRSLENMLDNSLYVTLQTTSVLAALASYPQPLIAHYLFDQRMLLQPSVKNFFKVMDSLKTRIDAYASSLDGFDVLLERGIKFLRSRAERYEKAVESSRQYILHLRSAGDSYSRNGSIEGMSSPKSLLNRFRPFSNKRRYPVNGSNHPHEFRIYTHKAMESRDVTLDHARAKQFVFAAIILSQFCQELAATVLQHSTVVPRPKGNLDKI
uniref:FHF complex subunit HOOK-interacting protein C-terminal domain-containing protein n=1 Tax=Setaria digitata TaxID=48799 RepID=A0A915Q0L8_9BILA